MQPTITAAAEPLDRGVTAGGQQAALAESSEGPAALWRWGLADTAGGLSGNLMSADDGNFRERFPALPLTILIQLCHPASQLSNAKLHDSSSIASPPFSIGL
jgi:hypothetical protein